jgi:hypothetical protein
MRTTDVDDKIEGILNLLFAKSRQVSSRSSIGWALLDDNNAILHSNSIIAGTSVDSLPNSIKQFRSRLSHLVLTIEPGHPFFDVVAMTTQIETSNCMQITAGYELPEELKDSTWLDWERKWPGKVEYFRHSKVAKNICSGIRNYLLFNRPWVTAISASTIGNQSLQLINLRSEFGFTSYLESLTKQCGAVLYTENQSEIVGSLPRFNQSDRKVDFSPADNIDQLVKSLEKCNHNHQYSVLLLCDAGLLTQCTNLNLVDEINHHIAISCLPLENKPVPPGFLSLDDWTLINSDIVGNCIRMKIKKREGTLLADPASRNRLN